MMSSGSDVLEQLKDLYGIVLFFRDNAVDEDFYDALDNVLRMIEEFLGKSDVGYDTGKEFLNRLYNFVRSNPLTKFLAIYIRDYL